MSDDDESDLIARSRGGDWEAFAEIVRRHQRVIHHLTYQMSGSAADSEDLAHETFILAYRALDSFRGDSTFASWLYRIAVNRCLKWRRSEARRREAQGAWVADSGVASEPDASVQRVRSALARLSPKLRAAVVLTALDGLSHREAAGVLGCTEKTLSWRVHQARKKMEIHLRLTTDNP